MKPLLSLAVGGLAVALFSCSGSGGSGGSFRILSCNLGCSSSGSDGSGQISCGIQDVFVNGEIRIVFNKPVQESSLTVFSLQMTELGSGKTPPADRFVDLADPTTAIYRPKLTFDSSGAPVFGLTSSMSYTLKLPGTVQDPGDDYITSTGGQANQQRLLCTVEASLGVQDAKAGSPTVEVLVDKVLAYDPDTGEPVEFALGVPAEGEVDVFRDTLITLTFDDLMNPATLVNPVTGESNTLSIAIDPDGITSDPTDQQELAGQYSINLDQNALTTTVVFTPELGLPSAGSDPINKRKIVVDIPASVSDLGGNPVSNAGQIIFVPEFIPFEETDLIEGFEGPLQQDVTASGADWGETVPGALLPGIAGGSGKHGDLSLATGQLLVLNTDFEDFSGVDASMFTPSSALEAVFDGSTSFTVPPVTDGIFEFASLNLATGSQLSFEGSRPARVFVRGELRNLGRIDVAGRDALEHDAKQVFGQASAPPGPSGGAGGEGGRMPTWVGFETVIGTTVPDGVTPPVLAEIDGQDGIGVADNLITPSGTNLGFGGGGLAWPQATPTLPTLHLPVDPADIDGVEFDVVFACQTKMKGGVGAGGGFGLDGGQGVNKVFPAAGFAPPEAPLSAAGQASDFGLGIGSDPTSPQRTLDPETGYLHGGPGAGGGGGHIALTTTNGKVLTDCTITTLGPPAMIINYRQQSGAAGGAGGGALQIQAGGRAVINGVVDASGGSGGSKPPETNTVSGGGGAGGAVLLQSPVLQVAASPGRLDISGGLGGFGVGASLGGDGGAGLLRYETSLPLPDPELEGSKILPAPGTLAALGAEPIDILSIGELTPITVGPGVVNGVQSCWLRPDGNFFLLTFLDDVGDDLGWDMKILPNPPSLGEQSYRGDNDLFLAPIEDVFGSDLGSSPLVVRFQGARAIKTIENPCEIPLGGEESPIFPGSVTGWVKHPAELNTYFPDPALRPNLIRFQILFDTSQASFSALAAVTELNISVLPD